MSLNPKKKKRKKYIYCLQLNMEMLSQIHEANDFRCEQSLAAETQCHVTADRI